MERSTIIGAMNSVGSTLMALAKAARNGASQVAAFAEASKRTLAEMQRFQNNIIARMAVVGRTFVPSSGPARYADDAAAMVAAKRAARFIKANASLGMNAQQIIAEAPGHIREKFAVLKRLEQQAA